VKASPGQLLVGSVQSGSPAAKAGLKENDRILEVNGRVPGSLLAFNRLLCAATNREATLSLSRAPKSFTRGVRLLPLEALIRQKLGLTLLEPTAQKADRLGIRAGEGLFIEGVEEDGPAAQASLQRGFVLAAIEGQKAAEVRNVGGVLSTKNKGDTVNLTVIVPHRIGASFVQFQQGTVELKVR
jgi:S1-C subfamily serine protease